MRRSLILAVTAALLAGLAIAGVTLATDAAEDETTAGSSSAGLVGTALAGQGSDLAVAGLPDPHAVFRSLAQRLAVSEPRLLGALASARDDASKTALDEGERAGVITAEQREALERCYEDRSRCDADELRALERELEGAGARRLDAVDLDVLKAGLAGDLAAELGTSRGAVVAATRAELASVLDRVVRGGLVTGAAHGRILGCFDDPEGCDVDALRREVPLLDALRGGLGARLGRRD